MPADAKLKIAVAGLGRIGWNFHAKRIDAHADFELVAVADNVAERRAEAEEVFDCRSHADFGTMIAEENLDAVVIATPTHLHRDMALSAFDLGLHVLLEKPMAPDLAEATEIVEASEKLDRVLTVYQPHRLGAYFQHLKAIVDSGQIGQVTQVLRGAFNYARRNDWQSLQKYGGGMLNNYGAHYLDQVLQLIGYDIKRVVCDLQLVASLGDADDVVKVLLETEGGVLGDVTINQASVINPFELAVWGTCGAVVYTGKEYQIKRFDPDTLPAKELNADLASENRKYPSDQIEFIEETVPVDDSYGIDVFADFARAIRDGVPPIVRPRETLALMGILAQCRESSAGIQTF